MKVRKNSVFRLLLAVGPALLQAGGCEPLKLDPFLYDPLPAPEDGYQLSTEIITQYEEHFIDTPDGERLHAVFIPSQGTRPDVTLLYFHGQSHNLGSIWQRIELLYPLGYNILAVDPRGYGRSTGTPSEKGIQIDVRAAYAFISRHPQVNPNRLVYYGRSLGAALAIDLASADDHEPAVLVTESAFTSVAALVQDGTYVDFPRSFVAKSVWDNLAKIRKLKCPFLALHGTADPYVPFRYSRELVDAHPGRHELIAVEGADHGNVPQTMGAHEYRTALARFIEAGLP
jgi:uncharacterized protein